MVQRTSRKNKIQAYFRAKKLIDNGATIAMACEQSNIALMTYYKYKKMFGDNEPNEKGMIELVPPQQTETKTNGKDMKFSSPEKELEFIIKENAALKEQLQLRQELAKYVQH
jgi:hypothetical protein